MEGEVDYLRSFLISSFSAASRGVLPSGPFVVFFAPFVSRNCTTSTCPGSVLVMSTSPSESRQSLPSSLPPSSSPSLVLSLPPSLPRLLPPPPWLAGRHTPSYTAASRGVMPYCCERWVGGTLAREGGRERGEGRGGEGRYWDDVGR